MIGKSVVAIPRDPAPGGGGGSIQMHQAGTNRSRMLRADKRLMSRSDRSGRISVATAGRKGIISDMTCTSPQPVSTGLMACNGQACLAANLGYHIAILIDSKSC